MNAVAVLELHGTVTAEKLKEISSILSALYKKTKYLGVDFSGTSGIDNKVLAILANFKKVVQQKGGVISLFTHNESIKNSLAEQDQSSIFLFNDDSELIKYIKSNK